NRPVAGSVRAAAFLDAFANGGLSGASMAWCTLVVAGLLAAATPSLAQTIAPPEVIGTLAGPGSGQTPGLAFYGTDLGWTFEHRGKLLALFGDTWPFATFLCDPSPLHDYTQHTLP